jgi:hypothetical protein
MAMLTTPILCSLSLAVIFSTATAAQTPDVSGTWVSDSDSSLKWILDQKDGKIRIQEVAGDKVKADFTCSLSGQECPVKEDGRSTKLIMYFNGAALVKISERGEDTVKQRLTVSDDGKTLNVKTVPLSSTRKAKPSYSAAKRGEPRSYPFARPLLEKPRTRRPACVFS